MNELTRKRFTNAINFCIFVFGLQLTMMGPLLDKMAASFEISISASGSFFSFSSAGFVAAIIFAGILADRIGKKKIIVLSVFGFAVSLMLFSMSDWFPLSAVLFFAAGGFGGIIESMLSALVAEINVGYESRSVIVTQVYFGLGAIIGPAAAGFVADSSIPWQACYAFAGILALVAAIWVVRYEYPPLKPEERIVISNLIDILRNVRFLLLCAAVALYVGVEVSVWGWMPKYLTSEMNYDGFMAGILVSGLWVTMTAGRIMTAWLTNKFPNSILVKVLCLLAIIGLAAQFVSFLHPYILVFIVFIGLGFSGIWPLIVSEAGTLFESKYTGTSFGLAVASGGIGSMVVPYALGFWAETVLMSYLIGLLSIIMLLVFVAHHFVSRRTIIQGHKSA